MNEKPGDARIRRILVALDASADCQDLLGAAAEMAQRLQAEMQGLFVEDIDLLRLASLPFARELLYPASQPRQLEMSDMERIFRARSERARKLLEAAAQRASVPWAFKVMRGHVEVEVVEQAGSADLLIIGKARRLHHTADRQRSTAYSIAARASCSVLLVQRGTRIDRPVMILASGPTLGTRALALAEKLAQSDDKQLVVLVPDIDAAIADALRHDVERALHAHKMRPRFMRLRSNAVAEVARAIREQGVRILVLDTSGTVWDEEEQQQIVNAVDCPVVLIRC